MNCDRKNYQSCQFDAEPKNVVQRERYDDPVDRVAMRTKWKVVVMTFPKTSQMVLEAEAIASDVFSRLTDLFIDK